MHAEGCGISTKAKFHTGTQLHPAGVKDTQKMQQYEKKLQFYQQNLSQLYCMGRYPSFVCAGASTATQCLLVKHSLPQHKRLK